MTREEHEAVMALERAAHREDATPELWGVLTSYRAGTSLVESLGRAIEVLTDPDLGEQVPTDELVEEVRRYAREAGYAADRADDAAHEARGSADEAEEALSILIGRQKRKARR